MPFHHSTNKPKQLNFQTLNIDIDAFMILLNPSGNNEVRNRSIIPSSYSIPTNIFMNAFLFSKHAWERKAINNYYWKCTKNIYIYCSSLAYVYVVVCFVFCMRFSAFVMSKLHGWNVLFLLVWCSFIFFSSTADKGNKSCW